MAVTINNVFGAVQDTATIAYTASGETIIHSIVLHNTHTASVTVDVLITPDGGSSTKFYELAIDQDATIEITGAKNLTDGDVLRFVGSVDEVVNYWVSFTTKT